MKILTEFEQNTPEWMTWREGKITGTKIGKVFAKSRKSDEMYDTAKRNLMYYQILAERLCTNGKADIDSENAMARGQELENEAIQAALIKLGKKPDAALRVGGWQDAEEDAFAESPDAQENWTTKPTWAIETKCVSAAKHLAAIREDRIPHWKGDETFYPQILNYFLVGKDIETLYFVLYNPDFDDPKMWVKIFTFTREGLKSEIDQMREIRDEMKRQMIEDLERLNNE